MTLNLNNSFVKIYKNPTLWRTTISVITFFILFANCQSYVQKVIKEKAVKNARSLISYQGTFTETGVLADKNAEISYQVYYQRPNQFFSKVTSQSAYKGFVFSLNKNLVRYYYPTTKFGVEIKNFPVNDFEKDMKVYDHSYDFHLERYKASLDGNGMRAGLKVVKIQYRVKTPTQFEGDWTSIVYPEYSFPIEVCQNSNIKYCGKFTNIQFNLPIADKFFDYHFPKGTTVARWNFNSKSYSERQCKKIANFKFPQPKTNLRYAKGIRVAGFIPGVALLYQDQQVGHYLLMTAVKDYGIKMTPKPKGLVFKIKGQSVFLNFSGLISNAYLLYKGVHLTFVSNRPYQMLLADIERTL